MTPSLSLHSSTKQEPLLCQWSVFSHFKCTFTICDSSNLEIRLKGVFFISEQSFKQLKECAQSATNSVPGREDARSMSAALRSLLILFSAERSCQRRSEHSNSETAAEERWGEREKSVYPCDDKGGLSRMCVKKCAEGRRAAPFLMPSQSMP